MSKTAADPAERNGSVKKAEKRAASAGRVVREPMTYERHAPVSYFQDLVLARHGQGSQRGDAEVRLRRHAQEMDVILREREERALRELPPSMETRVTPSRTQGQGGYFSPPAWLIEAFATAPRTGRVLSALMPQFDLPANVQSINVPLISSPGTIEQASVDGAPVPDSDLPDNFDSSAVVSIEGKADVGLQLLEQSPPGAHLDWAVFQDLSEAYDFDLEQQLLFGTGNNTASGPGNDQLQGVTSRTSINTVTWTTGSPTDVAFYNQLGITSARVGNNRKRPPEAWLMRTSRWAWMGSSPDASSRPFVLPTGVSNRQLVADPTGARVSDDLLGWAVYADDAIPGNLGAGGNQDEVIALRPSDLMLLEGPPIVSVLSEVLSGTLQARLIYRRYVAAITGRRQTGIAVLVGTGMILPTTYTT